MRSLGGILLWLAAVMATIFGTILAGISFILIYAVCLLVAWGVPVALVCLIAWAFISIGGI